jgi:lipoyl(octanoyl) transferase
MTREITGRIAAARVFGADAGGNGQGATTTPVEWARSNQPVAYPHAVSAMEARVEAIRKGAADELVWLLEHPPLYTAGTSARAGDLLSANRFPVYRSARGGQFTYHGPGQRVAYVMLDLTRRRRDVRAFVGALELWLVGALASLGVRAQTREDRVGVWVERSGMPGQALQEDKIAAIGVRIRHWISFHGIALNVAPDLGHFDGIVPCGVTAPGLGVTSLAALGLSRPMEEVDGALRAAFETVFGPTQEGLAPWPPES